jgi:UDP-2,3-diacylglucosamine pyrophosphatase LpxH
MKICVSDLHLGDKGARDNFIVRGEDRFWRFLDWVDTNDHQLYILGDLLEWWQCNIGSTIVAYQSLLKRLDYLYHQYTWGNHDNSLSSLPFNSVKLPPYPDGHGPFTRVVGSRTVLFCHGHEADPTCRDLNPGVGNITAIISGMLEDRAKTPNYKGVVIEDAFIGVLERALDFWRYLTARYSRRDELLDGVEKYRVEQQADVVVYGHTHEAGSIGDFHYNTGCWCRDVDTFAQVSDDGAVELFVWDGYKPVPFYKELR